MSGANPKVSVLVPIYNMERYLSECLDALCGQTLHDIEIVGINDGSKDSSLEILRARADRDSRIIIVDKPNTGYGSSMNHGLQLARGEYVGIVEPDDFPRPNMFKKLTQVADRYECDVVKCNYYEHFEKRDRKNKNFAAHPYGKVFDPADRPNIVCTIPSIWAGVYRREFLDGEGIGFLETPGASFQDASFSLKVWFAARRCALVRSPLLHYRMDNPGSSVKTADKVFAVCEELAESERFLNNRPDRRKRFIEWFHVDKWGKYRWNYDRIAEESRLAFMKRVEDEYRKAQNRGELTDRLFSAMDWREVRGLLEEGAEAFVSTHPDGF